MTIVLLTLIIATALCINTYIKFLLSKVEPTDEIIDGFLDEDSAEIAERLNKATGTQWYIEDTDETWTLMAKQPSSTYKVIHFNKDKDSVTPNSYDTQLLSTLHSDITHLLTNDVVNNAKLDKIYNLLTVPRNFPEFGFKDYENILEDIYNIVADGASEEDEEDHELQ